MNCDNCRDRLEQQRRSEVSRYKVFVKVLFNGKEVSKTESKQVTLSMIGLHSFMTSSLVPENFIFSVFSTL